MIVGLKYAPEKEITGLFSVHLPHRSLFAVDAYMNVSVPEFNSCTLSVKVNEKATKDYMVSRRIYEYIGQLYLMYSFISDIYQWFVVHGTFHSTEG